MKYKLNQYDRYQYEGITYLTPEAAQHDHPGTYVYVLEEKDGKIIEFELREKNELNPCTTTPTNSSPTN